MGGTCVASGWLTQISSVLFASGLHARSQWVAHAILSASFSVSFFMLVGGLHVVTGWLLLFIVYFSPVLVFSDWAALGLKRATPRVECVFVLGQTEI